MKVKDLYKVDMLAFNTKIGYITNLGTTFYAMQAQYPKGSEEYEEINRRLKLCCIEQNRTIDSAKGLKTKPFPKHWTQYQKISPEDDEETKKRKEFENKLVIDKRPEFMKFLYTSYAKEYKAFTSDFDKYSMIKFGKSVEEIRKNPKKTQEMNDMLEYYDKKNPLLETDGVMNRVCRYMQKELKDIKKIPKKCDNQAIFDKIFNKDIEIDEEKLVLMREKYKEYHDFKATKQLQVSEFSTYEQFYKYLRNDCMENISSNIQELANLAVYLCYQENSTKPKDFCWDVFGNGIVDNLIEIKKSVKVPQLDANGDIGYLGNRYKMVEISLVDNSVETIDINEEVFFDTNDLFNEIEDINDEI